MKLFTTLLAAAAAAMLFTGCASIQIAEKDDLSGMKLTSDKTDVAHINGSNWGLYLLWIPLLTGSTEKPGDISWNKDTVKVGPVTKMVTAKAKEMGASNVICTVSDRGGMMLPFPFPFLFYIESVEVSTNAVK